MTQDLLPNNGYVMVVEDDEFYGKIFQSKISDAGLPVKLFAVANEALAFAKTNPPKLIISDLIMPRLDGFKFIELVKQIDSLKNVPILVFSNLGQEKDIAEAKRLGASDYIIKAETSLSDAISKIVSWFNSSS